jgi:hypothetical protein
LKILTLKRIFEVCKSTWHPRIKEAGIYLHALPVARSKGWGISSYTYMPHQM